MWHTQRIFFSRGCLESRNRIKRRHSVAISVERALELLEDNDNSDDGMSSGEESDLDRELQTESSESQVSFEKILRERRESSHVL